MIISKPRQIRIDLDPDHGFPVAVSLESIRYVEEDGVKVADLPAHIESIAPDSDMAKAVLGAEASAATTALLTYQDEVQRLGRRVIELDEEATATHSELLTYQAEAKRLAQRVAELEAEKARA